MDIDEFLETEAEAPEGGRKALVEKQAAEFITGRSIEDQINKIRELMQQKQFKEAEKIYYLVKEHYATLARRQQEERRMLHRQLTQINKELLEHLDSAKTDMEQKAMIISDLLVKARQYMQQGNIDKANQLYFEVRRIFGQMPDAFAERKMVLDNQILAFYSQLVNEFNRKKYDELLRKRDEILRHIEIAANNIRLGNVEAAGKEYQLINKLYNELPEGFLYEKTLLYKRILALYQGMEEGNIRGIAASSAAELATMPAPQLPYRVGAKGTLQEQVSAKKERERTPIEIPPPAQVVSAKKGFFRFMKKEGSKEEPLLEKREEKKIVMDAPPLPI